MRRRGRLLRGMGFRLWGRLLAARSAEAAGLVGKAALDASPLREACGGPAAPHTATMFARQIPPWSARIEAVGEFNNTLAQKVAAVEGRQSWMHETVVRQATTRPRCAQTGHWTTCGVPPSLIRRIGCPDIQDRVPFVARAPGLQGGVVRGPVWQQAGRRHRRSEGACAAR